MHVVEGEQCGLPPARRGEKLPETGVRLAELLLVCHAHDGRCAAEAEQRREREEVLAGETEPRSPSLEVVQILGQLAKDVVSDIEERPVRAFAVAYDADVEGVGPTFELVEQS